MSIKAKTTATASPRSKFSKVVATKVTTQIICKKKSPWDPEGLWDQGCLPPQPQVAHQVHSVRLPKGADVP